MIAKRSALVILLLFLPATAFAAKRYVVKKGDNLYNLAKRFHVSLQAIKKANRRSSDRLNIGDTLLIPNSSNGKVLVNQREYIVVQGDTLFDIGKKFGVSAKEIIKANNLKSNNLEIGQRLIIPSLSKSIGKEVIVSKGSEAKEKELIETKSNLPSVSLRYIVKEGDTLGRIAKQFSVSVRELKRANGLTNDRLKMGRILTIPDSGNRTVIENLSSEPLKITPKEVSSYQPRKYLVKKGDTLGKIAKRFGVSVRNLKNTNRIRGTTIRIGQVLSIPGQSTVTGELSIEDIEINGDKTEGDKTEVKTSSETEFSDDKRSRNVYVKNNGIPRDTIMSVAKKFLGAPYKFGGTSLIKGIDCSAFVNKVFGFFNVDLPRTAREIYKVGRDVDRAELSTGDLVFFRTYARYPSHVGIYIGDDEFIHASSKEKRVTISNINRLYYRKRYIGARRIESTGLFYEELSKDYKGFEKQ